MHFNEEHQNYLTVDWLLMMASIEIEELSNQEYSFTFSKLTNYENEMNFLLKLTFLKSICNNPLLTLKIDSSIIDNDNLCKFLPSPSSISIQLDNYQKLSEDEVEVLQTALSTQSTTKETVILNYF